METICPIHVGSYNVLVTTFSVNVTLYAGAASPICFVVYPSFLIDPKSLLTVSGRFLCAPGYLVMLQLLGLLGTCASCNDAFTLWSITVQTKEHTQQPSLG